MKLFFSLLTCLIPTLSFASDKGNGGGGICFQSNCYTMAEAGLRIPADPIKQPWLPSPEVVSELEKIEKAMPFSGLNLTAKAFGKSEYYKIVSAIDDKKFFKTIVREYQKQMANANFSVPGKLEIFAVSLPKDGNTVCSEPCPVNSEHPVTFLLPSFFSLNPRQQALTLIHEQNIRAGRNLRFALQFDGLLLDYLSRGKDASYDSFPFYGALNAFADNLYSQSLWSNSLIRLEQRAGRHMTLADFMQDENYNLFASYLGRSGVDVYSPTALSLIKGTQITPNFRQVFAHTSFKLVPTTASASESKKACSQVSGETEYASWIIFAKSTQGKPYAVNCAHRLPNGDYQAAWLTAENIETLNGSL